MSKQERYAGASALQGLSLGQQSAYISQYTPALLQPVPRSLNRNDLGLDGELPFQGCDVWTLYELSWLNAKGKPMVAVGEVSVPATSANLIESKSFKLYLNSFNQTRLAGVDALVATLTRDLSAAAGAPVGVHVAPLSTRPQRPMGYPKGILLDGLEIDVDLYTPEPALLTAEPSPVVSEEAAPAVVASAEAVLPASRRKRKRRRGRTERAGSAGPAAAETTSLDETPPAAPALAEVEPDATAAPAAEPVITEAKLPSLEQSVHARPPGFCTGCPERPSRTW